MPQNKPMKIQWITVNGRQVPLVLPQTYSYEIEDWKVTSDRDPLPVVEYGTTEGGVIVPKRVSDEGHELTQLTGSIVEEYSIKNETIPANSSVSFYYKFKGSRVGLSFITREGQVRMSIRANETTTYPLYMGYRKYVNEEPGSIGENTFILSTPINEIMFHNENDEDIEIRVSYIIDYLY